MSLIDSEQHAHKSYLVILEVLEEGLGLMKMLLSTVHSFHS